MVEAVGPGVSGFAAGDRIGYVTAGYGGYASHRLLPAALALRLPDGMSERLAASVLLKGLTAEMLLRQVHRVEAGQTLLVQAAAGGVGRLLCQWAAHLGATVIGTVGSAAKAEIARAAGCHHVILYREEDFVAAGEGRSPAAAASMRPMTRSATTPSTARSNASPCAATW